MEVRALIMAAGKGSRMKSDLPKVLNLLDGEPFVKRVADALQILQISQIGIIVSSATETGIRECLGNSFEYIPQKERLGTGHAVMCAEDWLRDFEGELVVVVGDAPFITQEVIINLVKKHQDQNNVCTLLSAIWKDPPPYGRIIRNQNGKVTKIVEEKDASNEEIQIKEANSSHYCFRYSELKKALSEISFDNAQNEYYLSDVIEIFIKEGKPVEAVPISNPIITAGINTQEELVEFKNRLKEVPNK